VPKLVNLIGETFGRLVVVEAGSVNGRRRTWMCRCSCGIGVLVRVTTSNLRGGNVRSCGCLAREHAGSLNVRHGQSRHSARSAEWLAWQSMHRRVRHKPEYAYVPICERWYVFENFLADMGEKPSQRHSIDRRDNDRGYEPDNCRWATPKEQANNRRNSRDRLVR
jgi:hypothetical protein